MKDVTPNCWDCSHCNSKKYHEEVCLVVGPRRIEPKRSKGRIVFKDQKLKPL